MDDPKSMMVHNVADMLRLWKFCEKFIKREIIICPESVHQMNVIINAYGFIEGVCDIVGYYDEHDSFSKPK